MAVGDPEAFTVYGWIVCVWVLIVSFQYGFHISSLNQISGVLTCRKTEPDLPSTYYGLPTCIAMDDATFSVLTSVYTVGGLLGSLGANVVMDRWGRKGACLASAFVMAVGAGFMAVSATLPPLIIGRLLTGVAAGLGLCVGPIYISEIAPTKIKGAVGVLTQFAIVVGIMITQAMGLQLATPRTWRLVLLFSSALSLAQLLAGPMIVESPAWLNRHGLLRDKAASARRLWKSGHAIHSPDVSNEDAEDPLLGADEESTSLNPARRADEHEAAVNVPQVLLRREFRKPLAIVCFSMLCQQLSGVNAVLYYSNNILSKALPDVGPYVSLGITIVNFFMTAAPIFLIDRLGRKKLLSLSATGAIVSLVVVGFGLDSGAVLLASTAIITFVASFAIGIGPVPFVMIPEVSPHQAVSALSSVGLSLNWIANFLVGLVFLPLRDFLSNGDVEKEGRVFYVFAALLSFFTFMLFGLYRG
ncbi:general substrate transporter [Trametes versicolor FP-101664 SS1]|uniref:general substrate transporter n=1 Tax=Trametes versicolor (strain FP-101664) TaxID=717944 RepID=UPI00046212C5|nr:general substrate transporter [Trametes versicolor FP-101664 SS1]EIW60651.1 general substrate transporter [Trametes versicolor FP-101664 SS1]